MVSQQILGTERISKLLIKYSIPAIIGMLVNSLYNVVDRIFIGNIKGVGSLAITGLGVTMPIMTIILAFGMLIGIGTTATISLKLGEGKVEDAQKLIGNAMTLSVVVGIILTIIGLIFQDQILVLFGASDKTIFYAKEYINIILMGTVVNLLAFSLNLKPFNKRRRCSCNICWNNDSWMCNKYNFRLCFNIYSRNGNKGCGYCNSYITCFNGYYYYLLLCKW